MRRAIGTVLPSSNRTVERATIAALRHFPSLDAAFARIPFHGAGLGQPRDGYDHAPYREAAALLGHAKVEVVCWNGSRGAALGLAADEALCEEMARAAGCAATTSALAARVLLGRLGARRLGFVVAGDMAEAEAAARGLGGEPVAARGLGLTDNLAAASVAPEVLSAALRDVAQSAPDALLVWSTNLPGFLVAAALERELGIPVLDAALAGVWGALRAIGEDPSPARPLGRIFGLT